MGKSYYLAGVSTVDLFKNGELVATAKTLIENSIRIQTQRNEVRGGYGSKLIGIYTSNPNIEVEIENALFNLDWIKETTGGEVKLGIDYLDTECILCRKDGEVVVNYAPEKFYNSVFIFGWSVDTNETLEFEGRTLRSNNFKKGKIYTIKYYHDVPDMKEVVISSTYIPTEMYAIFSIPLFFTPYQDAKTLKRIGKLQIEVPRLQLDGNTDILMNMRGYSTTKIKGNALLAQDENSFDRFYLRIKEDIKDEVLRLIEDIDNMSLESFDNFVDIKEADVKIV
ncbi:MAG: hypothetical protein ACRCX8_15810 [Sarcina sp.]